MIQDLTTATVDRHIQASPEALYDIVADVTRTPELSQDVVSCAWLDGATGPTVGARFKAVNRARRGPHWSNKPVVIAAERGRAFAFSRTEPFAGTLEWRYTFTPEGTGTRVTESFDVTRQISPVGWFIIDTLFGMKDQQNGLRDSMLTTLDRLAAIAESTSRSARTA
ncbi:MAG: SRPBCC family protein [Dermatophilaceae bacterium]